MTAHLWPTYYRRTRPPQADGKPVTLHQWMERGFVCELWAGWSHWSISVRVPGITRPLVEWFSPVVWGMKPGGLDMGELMDDLIKKALQNSAARTPDAPPKAEGILSRCRYLWAFLTAVLIEKGRPARQTSTVLFFFEQGVFKACLSDRENKRVAWSSGDSLEAVLEALEGSLADGSIEWRPARQWGKK